MTVNIPERLAPEVINLLTREVEKQIAEKLKIEKKLSDAQYALDYEVRKTAAAQEEASTLRKQIAELQKDEF